MFSTCQRKTVETPLRVTQVKSPIFPLSPSGAEARWGHYTRINFLIYEKGAERESNQVYNGGEIMGCTGIQGLAENRVIVIA